jgi:hypothetical protein
MGGADLKLGEAQTLHGGATHHAFVARLPDAVVGIKVPAATPSAGALSRRGTLDAALALARAEPWIALLEDWFGAGLMPVPAPADPAAAAARLGQHARLCHEDSGLELQLPLVALAELGRPLPDAFAAWRWQPVQCTLVLDAMALGEADARALAPGAVLLLPASFSSTWQARLVPAGGQGGLFGARLHEARGRLCVSPTGERVQHAGNDHASVHFAAPVVLRPPDLLGWTGGGKPSALDMAALLSPASMVLHSSPLQQQRVMACGQLMPVGSGYGVRIESVPSTPAAQAAVDRLSTDASFPA